MMDDLAQFIMETVGEPRRYGWSDCAPWVLRWVTRRSGMAAAIPRYDGPREALRLIRVHGGVDRMVAHYARRCGLLETRGMQRGDVAVLKHPVAMGGMTAAICTQAIVDGYSWWAFKRHDGGVEIARGVKPITVWRVPDMNSAPRL